MSATPTSDRGCIASLCLQVQPAAQTALQGYCAALPGWEVLDTSVSGQIIILAEADSDRALLATIDSLLAHPDVLQIAPFYQESFQESFEQGTSTPATRVQHPDGNDQQR